MYEGVWKAWGAHERDAVGRVCCDEVYGLVWQGWMDFWSPHRLSCLVAVSLSFLSASVCLIQVWIPRIGVYGEYFPGGGGSRIRGNLCRKTLKRADASGAGRTPDYSRKRGREFGSPRVSPARPRRDSFLSSMLPSLCLSSL